MTECSTCEAQVGDPIPRWKAPLLFVGVLLFCPCHLPATFAVFAAVGTGLLGAGWLFGSKILVYALFSVVYLVFLVFFLRWFFASRRREVDLEASHASHLRQT